MRSSSHVQLALFYSRMRIPPTNVADVNYIRERTTYSQNIPCILAILMTSLYNTKMNAYDAIKYGSAAYHIQTSEYKITQHGNAVGSHSGNNGGPREVKSTTDSICQL